MAEDHVYIQDTNDRLLEDAHQGSLAWRNCFRMENGICHYQRIQSEKDFSSRYPEDDSLNSPRSCRGNLKFLGSSFSEIIMWPLLLLLRRL